MVGIVRGLASVIAYTNYVGILPWHAPAVFLRVSVTTRQRITGMTGTDTIRRRGVLRGTRFPSYDPELVYVEGHLGDFFFEKEHDVDVYEQMFDALVDGPSPLSDVRPSCPVSAGSLRVRNGNPVIIALPPHAGVPDG
jgi:hypothetical protein